MSTADHPGAVLRQARTARGWTQTELGRRCGLHASAVSRYETGAVPLRDVPTMRAFAEALALPVESFGLAPVLPARALPRPYSEPGPAPTEEDPMRRRTFLIAAGGMMTGLPTGSGTDIDPARLLTRTLGDALLLGPTETDPGPAPPQASRIAEAREAFTRCDYLMLADRLPPLLAATQAAADRTSTPDTHALAAAAYTLTTEALIKLTASGLEWVAADRAQHHAHLAEDPLVLARAQRMLAAVARRAGHHDHAQHLTLDAAAHLDPAGHPDHALMHGMLHCTASYAAAQAGDRDRSHELLADAAAAVTHLAENSPHQRTLLGNLVSYRICGAHALGDPAAGLAHAHHQSLAVIPTVERRARVLVDTARCWYDHGNPERAYRTLLAAERTAPGEVHTRAAVRTLVTDLRQAPRQNTMPHLADLAHRVHATQTRPGLRR
ncbi:helix-turn-helix domain-containing protein [Actinokineospora enzanensis]|uniref:helix-turn-helix domain-containing protein n=1 Tax=Actinokineospora enzanensis TaxID=155975 RepID=UPI00037D83ED|nr:helix-turn-helix transcriptional regulator [Actinokineospora enzanensis]